MQAIRHLSEDESALFFRLRAQLQRHSRRNRDLVARYDGEHHARQMGITIPPAFSDLKHVISWPALAVDKVIERYGVDGFVAAGQEEADADLRAVFDENGMDLQQTQLGTDAGITGCAFQYVYDDPSKPSGVGIRAYSSMEATGTWSQSRLGLLNGLVVESEGSIWTEGSWLLLLPDKTARITVEGGQYVAETFTNWSGSPSLIPLAFNPLTRKPFGQSLITPGIRSATDQAARITLRAEVGAEFYSVPKMAALGADENAWTDEEGRELTEWEVYVGVVMKLGLNQDTLEKPDLKQFPQQSMEPHFGHLRMLAAQYTDESGVMTSFSSSGLANPESAASKIESKSALVSKAEQLQRSTAYSWSSLAQAVKRQMNRGALPPEASALRPKWRDAAAPTKAAQAANVRDLIEAGVLPPTSEVTMELLGFDSTTISRLKADQQSSQAQVMLEAIAAARGAMLPKAVPERIEVPRADAG